MCVLSPGGSLACPCMSPLAYQQSPFAFPHASQPVVCSPPFHSRFSDGSPALSSLFCQIQLGLGAVLISLRCFVPASVSTKFTAVLWNNVFHLLSSSPDWLEAHPGNGPWACSSFHHGPWHWVESMFLNFHSFYHSLHHCATQLLPLSLSLLFFLF